MRHVRTTVLLLMLLPLLNAAPAFAGEAAPTPDTPKADEPKLDEPKPEPDPDPEKPAYSIEYLMPGEDDESDDWKIRDSGAPAGSPTEAILEAMSAACSCGLDEDSFYVETAVYKKGDAKVAVAMVDVDKSVWAFRQKVGAAAKTHGWHVAELGAKGRLLIVGAGEKQAEVIGVITEQVVYTLGRLAMDRVRGGGGREEAGRKAAIAYSEAIGRMAPDTGVAHGVVGVVHWLKSRPKKRGEKADAPELELCEAAWRKAFAVGVKFPPKKGVLVFCSGEYGQILLEKKDKSVLVEATHVLQIAVDNEQEGKNGFSRFSNRYNLACCFVRAGDLDKGLKQLKGALQTGKSMKVSMFRPQYINIRDKDPDMAALRDDPRFSKLMADFKPPEKPKGHGNPHGKKGNPHK